MKSLDAPHIPDEVDFKVVNKENIKWSSTVVEMGKFDQ